MPIVSLSFWLFWDFGVLLRYRSTSNLVELYFGNEIFQRNSSEAVILYYTTALAHIYGYSSISVCFFKFGLVTKLTLGNLIRIGS